MIRVNINKNKIIYISKKIACFYYIIINMFCSDRNNLKKVAQKNELFCIFVK